MGTSKTSSIEKPDECPQLSRPKLREASFEDYEQIAAVLNRNGLSARSRAEWIGLWSGNPAYEPVRERWPLGWVLEAEQGRIVGSIGNLPGAYLWNGQFVRSATPCDWAVDREYRAHSMVLLQRFANQPLADLLLATTVGMNAEPSYVAFKWSKPPVGRWGTGALWITGYGGFLKSVLAKKAIRLVGPVRHVISAVWFCRDRVMNLLARPASSLRIEQRSDFDGRFDVFWEELQRQESGVLLALRSREALVWRFHAAHSRPWIVTASNSTGLVAYAVFVRWDNPKICLNRLRLVDFQALANDREALGQILKWVTERCRLADIHVVEDVGCVLESRGIAKAPYHRGLGSWMYYYKAKRADLAHALKDPTAWSLSGVDGDMNLSCSKPWLALGTPAVEE